jgi:hypothetical protein
MIRQYITEHLSELIAYGIIFYMLVSVTWVKLFLREEVMADLRGPDKQWQIIELSAVMWWLIFPSVIAASMLGVDVPTGVWTSLDTVYGVNILGKAYLKGKEQQTNTPPTP